MFPNTWSVNIIDNAIFCHFTSHIFFNFQDYVLYDNEQNGATFLAKKTDSQEIVVGWLHVYLGYY